MLFSSKYKDRYAFVVDPDPVPGFDWQPGDATWQSAWLYAAYCRLSKEEWKYRDWFLSEWDGDPIGTVERFLSNFYEHCCRHDRVITHPQKQDHWSQDQAWPMLLLLASVYRYQPHLRILGAQILKHFIHLDINRNGWLNPDVGNKGNLENNMRTVISELAKCYGTNYPEYGSHWLNQMAKGYAQLWRADSAIGIVPDKAKPPSYTIWNNLGGLLAAAICCPCYKVNGNNFSWFADNGWGAAYQIVAGKPCSTEQVEWYRGKQTQFIDIIHQRGKQHKLGDRPSLDYPIVIAIRDVWSEL